MSTSLGIPSLTVMKPRLTWKRVRVLGRGTYGVVYLATCQTTNSDILRLIAIKTSLLEKASSLEKEFRILKYFRHCPEIIPCFAAEVSVEHGFEFYNLFLKYTPLGTLQELIGRNGSPGLPEKDVRSYTRMILKGLCFIHTRGYVHCDLKLENILVFPSQQRYNGCAEHDVKIADFGLAKEPEEHLPPADWKGTFRGTPVYMSPESVVLGEIGPELDVWSLGCVVLEMLTGRGVWSELSTADIKCVLSCPMMLPEVPEHISDNGKDFLRKCFERDHKKRWSAQLLLQHPFVTPTRITLFGQDIVSF